MISSLLKPSPVKIASALCLATFCAIALKVRAADAPSKVVMDYYRTLSAAENPGQLEKFETKRWIQQEQSLSKDAPEIGLLSCLRQGKPKEVRVMEETIDGDQAKINLQGVGKELMATPAASQPNTVQRYGVFFLTNENGQWKIDAESWGSERSLRSWINPNDFRSWANDAAHSDYCQLPIQCRFDGKLYQPTKCTVGVHPTRGGTWLQFLQTDTSQPNSCIAIELLDDTTPIEGKVFEVKDGKLSWSKPTALKIVMESKNYPSPRTYTGTEICGLKLKFDKATAGGIPGKIILRLTSQPETSIKGAFLAEPGP